VGDQAQGRGLTVAEHGAQRLAELGEPGEREVAERGEGLGEADDLKSPSATLSPAEAISVVTNGLAMAAYYGDGEVKAADLPSRVLPPSLPPSSARIIGLATSASAEGPSARRRA